MQTETREVSLKASVPVSVDVSLGPGVWTFE